jgi:hypothetical protein
MSGGTSNISKRHLIRKFMAAPQLDDYIIVFELLTANLPEQVIRIRRCRTDWRSQSKGIARAIGLSHLRLNLS